MRKTVKITPSNSIIFVSDVDGGVAPEAFKYDPIMSTPTCIAIGVLTEYEGETTIMMVPSWSVARPDIPVFDGMLDTPTGQVVVSMVDRTVLLESRSGETRTRIRVWTNDAKQPDEVLIAFGS